MDMTYGYDCENRMVSSAEGTTGTDTNTYNGLGCRVSNHDFAGTYTNQTDGVDATSPVLYDGIEYFTPGFSSEDMTNGGLKYYTEPDQIGTTLGMTNTSQSQVYAVEYDAFGDIVDTTGSFTDTYAFVDGYAGTNGYQTDRDTGFIRCGNRFYSPYFGRFITQDPAGAGMNWYDYCGNDPTGAIDPDGLDDSPPPNPGLDPSLWDIWPGSGGPPVTLHYLPPLPVVFDGPMWTGPMRGLASRFLVGALKSAGLKASKFLKNAVKIVTPVSQRQVRGIIVLSAIAIASNINSLRNPSTTIGGNTVNALVGASSAFQSLGLFAAGDALTAAGTTGAAATLGGVAYLTGIGEYGTGLALATTAAYTASNEWTSTTSSGQAATSLLGGLIYNITDGR